MGQAKRRETVRAQYARGDTSEPALDDSAVESILDPGLGQADGNPVAGIRNAIIVGTALWALLVFWAFI